MKRWFLLTLSLLLCFPLLAACQKEKEEDFVHLVENDPQGPYGDAAYPCYFEGEMNTSTAYPRDAERHLWITTNSDPETTESATVTFFGFSYTGTPQRRYQVPKVPYEAVAYRTENGEEFDLRTDTGEIVFLDRMGKGFFAREYAGESAVGIEAAREIALDAVRGVRSADLSVYREKPVKEEIAKSEIGREFRFYTFTFVKPLGEIDTMDRFSVRVTSNGTVASVTVGSIGAFDEFTAPDLAAANASLVKALPVIFSNTNHALESYTIVNQTLTLTKEGKMVLCHELSLTLIARTQHVSNSTTTRMMITELP